jgi:hypothetical protein
MTSDDYVKLIWKGNRGNRYLLWQQDRKEPVNEHGIGAYMRMRITYQGLRHSRSSFEKSMLSALGV